MPLNLKCGACVPLQHLSETFFIIIRNERDMIKHPRLVLGLLSSCTIVIPNYLIIGIFFEKMPLNLKCGACVNLQLLSETFFNIIRNERDMIKHPRLV
jgi:hypothetical protein